MLVYESTKQYFIEDVINDQISSKIENTFKDKMGFHTTKAEIKSWENSMRFMQGVLSDNGIPDNSGVAIEFKIPYTSKRIDFILSGKNENEENSAIIVELKQWEKAEIVCEKEAVVRTFVGGREREVLHPSYQAWSYANHIEDYNENVQKKGISVKPCAYLHNYTKNNPDQITSEVYEYYIEKAPVFLKGDALKLRDFIKKYIKYGDNKETLYLIENGKLRPSKSLQDYLGSMLKGNPEFVMIDDQKLVYETALLLARKSYEDGKKRVLVVQGGPGTGKTVVAVNLLVELTRRNMVCQYVSKNSAPRNVYSAKLKGVFKKNSIDNLFCGSGNYVNTEKNVFDALIVDESHRLNAKSGIYSNLGENQVKEIINASKFSLFFIDESQRIHIKDIGSTEEIMYQADKLGAEVDVMELASQFRCNGSDGYIAWLDDALGIRETGNSEGFDLDYDIQVVDDPNVLRDLIFEKNKENNKARLIAGYCWDWNSKKSNYLDDIVIEKFNFGMQWNFSGSSTWAIDRDSMNQIGCIHTSQGLEFDYVGVIIGPDLKYIDGEVVSDFTERSSSDRSIFGLKKLLKENPDEARRIGDEIVRNTYRTLMTRGQKGCFVYCVDKNLNEYFNNKISYLNKK